MWRLWHETLWSSRRPIDIRTADTGHRAFLKTVPRLYELGVAAAPVVQRRCRAILAWYERNFESVVVREVPTSRANFGRGVVYARCEQWRDAVGLAFFLFFFFLPRCAAHFSLFYFGFAAVAAASSCAATAGMPEVGQCDLREGRAAVFRDRRDLCGARRVSARMRTL
jgi:hypothetical protein